MLKGLPQIGLVLAAILCLAPVHASAQNTVLVTGPTTPDDCISFAFLCRTGTVEINRTDATSIRAISVTFTLSSNLDLCSGTASITEGSYLNSVGSTNFFVTTNAGNDNYTVDCAILGLPCGATAPTGDLFDVQVKKAPGPVNTGTGTITVTSVTIRDCNNVTIGSAIGSAASFEIDRVPPVAVTNLLATQVKPGNDTDGTTKVALTFSVPGDAARTEVWRAPFGNYPEYDDSPGAGAAPATPNYPPPFPWTLTSVTTSGEVDEVTTRDYWYYVIYTWDYCENFSAPSNVDASLNYHLGDVHTGAAACAGNNAVSTSDISFLGANYGITLGTSDPVGCLDIGPTADGSVDGRPTTDNLVQFEDFVLFAINFGQVSKTGAPAAAAVDELALATPPRNELAKAGDEIVANLLARGTGRVQALSTRLSWDAAVVEPVSVEAGELLTRQNGVVLSPAPGIVDAAVLGSGAGLSGEGVLAKVTFRVVGAGDPAIKLADVDARDGENQRYEIGLATMQPGLGSSSARIAELLPNTPNPFGEITKLSYRLGAAADVDLSIYSIDGRKVRTLSSGRSGAGLHELAWDGKNDRGERVSSGTFYVRLETAAGSWSRPLTLLK